MELRQLEHFVAVAQEGHFTRAASNCRISQSTLSMSIRSLERELGSPLFVRTTRKVDLTDAGRALLREARQTLAAAASARESVQALQGLLRGSLSVGGPATPGLLDQASLFARFRDLYPAVDIRYVRDSSTGVIPEVAAARLDVGLVTLPPELPEQVAAVPLITQPMVLVCGPGHPLAGQQRVRAESLADQDFIGPLPGHVGVEMLDRAIAAQGQRRRVSFEVNDVSAILDFVACGLGVALVPQSSAASRTDVRAVDLVEPTVTWTLGAVVNRHQTTPAARAFIALVPEFRTVDRSMNSG
jgi:DNA-binding transcriptional LysR family regulator